MIVGFALVVMYISASNCTGCAKATKMGRTEFWVLLVVNISLLAGFANIMHSKGYF